MSLTVRSRLATLIGGRAACLIALLLIACKAESRPPFAPTGSPPAIGLSSAVVSFSGSAGGADPAPSSVIVTNSGAGAPGDVVGLAVQSIAYGSGQSSGWLSFGLSSPQTPATLDLRPSTSTLPAGNYSAQITLGSTVTGVVPEVVTVAFAISAGPVISLAPSTAVLNTTAGSATQDVANIAVTNGGPGTLSGLVVDTIIFAAGQPTGWLTASLSAGTAPSTLSIQGSGAGLIAGTYTATVIVGSTLAGIAPATISVAMVAGPGPLISVSPSSVAFGAVVGGANPPTQTVAVTNSGAGTLGGLSVGTISYGPGATGWLSAGLSGTTAPVTLTLQPTTGALAAGAYSADVPINSSQAGVAPQTVSVTFTVAGGAVIGVAPASVQFASSVGGGNPAAQLVNVTNAGSGTLSGLSVGGIAYGSGQPTGWLAANLAGSTAPTTVSLQPTTGSLGAGTYSATVQLVSSTVGVPSQNVVVSFAVAQGPVIAASPAALTFSAINLGGNPTSKAVLITNAGGGTLSGLSTTVSYTSGQPTGWLAATLNTTTAPATLTLQASTGSLPSGTYTGTVRIASSVPGVQTADVAVTFAIGAGPTIAFSPASAAFGATVGGPAPPSQAITVLNAGGGTLSGLSAAQVTYGVGQPSGWLSTSLAGTTAPTVMTLQVNPSGLAAGSYSASVQVTSSLSGVAAATLPVNLTVSAVSQTPSAITIISGNNQSGFVGGFLLSPLVARVFLASGQPAVGIRVTWSADLDGGVFNADSVTDAQGTVRGDWRLATFTGPQHAQVAVAGLSPLVFNATASLPNVNFPNEPPGLTAVTDRAFDTKAASGTDRIGSEGWDPLESRYPNFTVLIDGTATFSPQKVGQVLYPAGFAGGAAPSTAQIAFNNSLGYKTFYHRFAVKVSANWQAHSTGTNKVYHMWIGDPANGITNTNRTFYSFEGAGSGPMFFQYRLQGTPDPRARLIANTGANSEIVRDRWYVIEVLVTLNTPNQADGKVQVWLNGVMTHNYSDVKYSLGGTLTFSEIQWSPTWGGGGDVVTNNMYMYMDHCYGAGTQ
jgi:hypothetical protein